MMCKHVNQNSVLWVIRLFIAKLDSFGHMQVIIESILYQSDKDRILTMVGFVTSAK